MQLVTWLAAVGQKVDRRRARAARQLASMPLSTGLLVACRWVDAGGGRGLRDERAVRAFFWGLALASLQLLERSGRSDWTCSRGPVRKTGGPCLGTLPADGAVRPVGRDRFTRTRWGRRRTGPDTLPAGGRSSRSDWTRSRGSLWATGGSGKP